MHQFTHMLRNCDGQNQWVKVQIASSSTLLTRFSLLDYFVFPNLKKWLGGQRFANNKEVEFAVHGYFILYYIIYYIFENGTQEFFFKLIPVILRALYHLGHVTNLTPYIFYNFIPKIIIILRWNIGKWSNTCRKSVMNYYIWNVIYFWKKSF